MKKNLILIAIIAVFSSACSQWVSVNPLSLPSVLDKKLEGAWKVDSKDGDEVYLHIGKKTENTMVAVTVEHKDDGSLDIAEIPFHVTMTGANNYFNIRYKDIDEDLSTEDDAYIFIKYSITDDGTLLLYQFDPDIIISAVQSGKLKGEITYREAKAAPESADKEKSASEKRIESVRITDTSENMVKFFNSEGQKFEPEVMKFVRVKK